MKNPYLMTMDSYHEVYSNADTAYVSYTPSKNPYLSHGWLKDAASKAKQKVYNSKYYQKNKELWKTKYYKYEKKGHHTLSEVKDAITKSTSSIGAATTNNTRYGAKKSPGVAQDFTKTSKTSPHKYGAIEEFVKDAIRQGPKFGLTRKAVIGAAGIIGGAATIGVGFVTANPLAVVGGAAMTAVGVASTVSAGRTVVEAIKAEAKGNQIERRKKSEPIDPKSGFHINTQNMTEQENVQAVNAKYKNLDCGTKNNCVLCSVTYEMRRRGYDVTANAADEGYYMADIYRWFPKAQPQKVPVSTFNDTDFKNMCLAQGEGASGVVMVTWYNGSGHAMHYQVKKGKVIVTDAQSGDVYDDGLNKLATLVNDVSICRLDNQEPDYQALRAEVCK